MPLWFAPSAGGGDDHHLRRRRLCPEVAAKLKDAGLSVETDLRNEKINYKVREHSLAKVPVILVCSKREAEGGRSISAASARATSGR